ncbi:MAG: hypothetical protein WBC80_15655, partial [Isosphaeraceae bacterium]
HNLLGLWCALCRQADHLAVSGCPPDMYAILFLILFALVGVLICGWGLFPTLTSEWLVIDLSRGIYRGRRGVLFWHERLDGPLDDFEEVRIVDVPSEHDPNQRQSVRACDRWAELVIMS